MKRFFLWLGAGIIILILGVVVFISYSTKNQTASDSLSNTSESAITRTQNEMQTDLANEGKYVDYDADLLANTSGTRILFFHAPWCPQCRQLEDDIKSGQIPENVTIFKVDYDSRQDLRKKYGVTIQTSLVRLDNNGNLSKKYVAYDEPTLRNLKDNLLR